MVIKRLSSAVVSSLRTDVTVTTTSQCVIELVLNAIDAGSTSVAVRIDLKNLRIQVIDNGCGLSLSDLNLIGTRYMTSKCHSICDLQGNLKYYGYRGEAMSSISDVCGTMTIVSRFKDSVETYCKIFSDGAAPKVGKSRHQRASCGTTVTVADFLYNRPVRRARIKPALDLEEVKTSLEAVALVNPQVSFSLRNDSNNDVIMQTQRVDDIPSVFRALYGNSIAKSLILVKESEGPFCVHGYISNEAHLLKNLQFIYVNKRLLLKTKIHKLVNSIMSRSAILKSNNVPHAPISKEINHNVFLAFSPPKRDKHAIFVLNITCPLSEYDITLDPKKTLVEFCNWDSLLTCFERLIRKFIECQAGTSSCDNNGSDFETPRRLETVVDEINELARQQALGEKIVRANRESISTKDLSRAVHSLPANRHQVHLTEETPTECILSTTSSEFFSGASTSGTFCNSAFTEQPYPPLTNKEDYQVKNAAVKNHGDFFLATSSDTNTSTNPKVTVGQSDFSSKNNLITSGSGNKPVKGFLPRIVHFEENNRKSLDGPHNKKSAWASTPPTPINALASIKEIRRKKLLSNLKKFSFNTFSRKPVLHNHQCISGNDSSRVQVIQNKSVSEPRDVQNEVQGPLPSSVHITDSHSIVATAASSGISVSKIHPSEASCPILFDSALPANPHNKIKSSGLNSAVSDDDGNRLNVTEKVQQCLSENYHQALLSSPSDLYKKSARNTSFASGETGSLPNILLENEIMLADHDTMQQLDSPSKVNASNIKGFVFDKLSVFSTMNKGNLKPIDTTHPLFESNCKTDLNSDNSFTNQSNTNNNCEDGNFEFACREQELLGNNMTSNTTKMLRIVDYDSSPPSSQENLVSESNSISPMSAEKRKGDDAQDCHSKRVCTSSKSSLESEHTNVLEGSSEGESTSSNAAIARKGDHLTPDTPPQSEYIITSSQKSIFETQCTDNSRQVQSNPVFDSKFSKSYSLNETGSSNLVENRYAQFVDTTELVWLQRFDHSGKPFYIHKNSGMTTYLEPSNSKGGQFKSNNRFSFLPKGMSPILNDKITDELCTSPSITKFHKNEEDLSAIKWDKKQSNQPDFWPLVDQLLLEADEFSSNLGAEARISNAGVHDLPKFDVKTYNVAFPCTFTKDIFNKLRVLGQLDNKFIVTIAALDSNKEVIVLFDQHAVHERIRVENLTEAYKNCDGSATWKSSSVEPALPLSLSAVEVRILESYKEKMESLGFFFTISDSNSIEVQRVPTCLLLRENREVNGRGISVLRQHLESLIREQVDSLLNTRGVGTDHPKIIQNVISYEACRGAVKFGHSLTVADCQAFLHNLSACDLPFQCAHGRPALVPIADLSTLKRKPQRPKPKLMKLKKRQ